jgi:hypothetical protein
MYDVNRWRQLGSLPGHQAANNTSNPVGSGFARLLRAWDEETIRGEEFLRRNAVLVGGDDNVYLYRLLPPDERGQPRPWAQGEELIANGGFDVRRAGGPLGWRPIGEPSFAESGTLTPPATGVIRSSPGNAYVTYAEVLPDRQYLLSLTSWSNARDSLARLHIDWLDAHGNLIGSEIETARVSDKEFRLRSMLAAAPPRAVTAAVYAAADRGEVWFDSVSLKSVPAGQRAVEPDNLLSDPGFDGVLTRASNDWNKYGTDYTRPAGVSLRPGSPGAAVYAWPESGYWQLVPIEGGRDYRLRYRAWSQDPNAQARLQINWYTLAQQPITSTIKVTDVGDRPIEFAAWMEAPPNAAFAQVYVSVQSGGPVWFADYALNAAGDAPR